jgi:hypothetical protein
VKPTTGAAFNQEAQQMAGTSDSALDLQRLEQALAGDSPFAEWHEIVNRVLTFYHRGLELLAERIPSARECLTALGSANDERRFRVLGDPVIRDAINEALAWVKKSSSEYPAAAEAILKSAIPFLRNSSGVSPLEGAVRQCFRIGESPHHAWVWWDDRAEDILGNRFRSLFEREIAHSISSKPAVLRTPDERLQKALRMGSQLLHTLLPDLSRSVLAHVHVVAVVDVSDKRQWEREIRADLCQNVSTHAIPGTIFLSPSPLRSSWHAAEALLHEAAHKKLSDLVLTRSIFRPGFAAATARTIRAVWNSPLSWNPNEWSTDRALFAFHVYVHLALFFRVVEARAEELEGEYGPLRGMQPAIAARSALDRARYLGTELQRTAADDLGPDGQALISWLTGILQRLDPFPPLVDPTMHLWLDRYDRETREIGNLISEIDPNIPKTGNDAVDAPYEEWSVHRIVDHLVQSELVAAYRVLTILGESDSPSLAFYDGDRWSVVAPSHATFPELAGLFQAVRVFLSRTLRHASAEAFLRTCQTRRTKTLKDIVEDMIEHPYRHVGMLVSRLRQHKKCKKPIGLVAALQE